MVPLSLINSKVGFQIHASVTAKPVLLSSNRCFATVAMICIITIFLAIIGRVPASSTPAPRIHAQADPLEKSVTKETAEAQGG